MPKGKMLISWRWLLIVLLIVLALSFGVSGCANRLPAPCKKSGREYCVTDEWTFSETWYSCYLRGISCTQGGCWENARDEFLRAALKRGTDERWVRTYGMHRLAEYFPNRELGVASYHLNDLDRALHYLSISLEQCESAKTKYYLNKVRKENLLLTREDREPPQLFLDLYPKILAQPSFLLSGLARDDTFVSTIIIQVNDEKPLSLIDLSQPLSYTFQQRILLQPGINTISTKVDDLSGKQVEQKITILVDQEGPMIYFAGSEGDDFPTQDLIQGLLYDPSEVTQFYLNEKRVELTRIETYEDFDQKTPYHAYLFRYFLSSEDRQKGLLHFQAQDRLRNSTTGTIAILPGEQDAQDAQEHKVSCLTYDTVRVAAATHTITTDLMQEPFSNQVAARRNFYPIQIQIGQVPPETFEEEICPQINILARHQVKEIFINEQPVLSLYGLRWDKLFTIMRKYLGGEKEKRFLFNRIIKLKEGKNSTTIKVVDQDGKVWEKSIRVIKKIKQIHKLQERWRIAIPFISYNLPGEDQEQKKREITYQLIEAFISQERFRVIDLDNLPIIIDEKNLAYSIGHPLLGLSDQSRIWIDVFLLGYVQAAEDSFTLSASLVDLDTGEILAIKDVFEEIDPSELNWQEGLREHTFQNCRILAAKLKSHFPVCEGKPISLTEEDIKTGICKNDGLKKGMKLVLYKDQNKEEKLTIIGEATVKEVWEKHSLAKLLGKLKFGSYDEAWTSWRVITR